MNQCRRPTRGNQKTAVQIDGKDLYLGVNAYVYADPSQVIELRRIPGRPA